MIYWLWLSSIQGVGPCTFKKLIERFGSPKEVFGASYDDLVSVRGISDKLANRITTEASLEYAEALMTECDRMRINIVKMNDDNYPKRILELSDAPPVLYYKGTLFEPEMTSGIVGPRRCTQETKEKTIGIACKCIEKGMVIVSGMARGVDGYAHTTAVLHDAKTIAVVGSGLDMCFPKEHELLFEKIQNGGYVISEYAPGVPPMSFHFPRRNRLIAAMSDELYVVEVQRNSGALITARLVKEAGKACHV